MTISVLILGEGSTDVGVVDIYGQWDKGCIINLLEKINPAINLEFIPPPNKRDISTIKTVRKKGDPRLEGHGKIIQKLILLARKNRIVFDLVVYYGDTDKESGTSNTVLQARRASQQAYEQAYEAFSYFDVDGIPIIPLRMLESWLLADERAFLRAFGIQASIPNNPELAWGDKNDPGSNHPKKLLERILNSGGIQSDRESFCELVDHIQIHNLESKCQISFPPFISKARELLR